MIIVLYIRDTINIIVNIVGWELKGRYCHRLRTALMPFWLSIDDMYAHVCRRTCNNTRLLTYMIQPDWVQKLRFIQNMNMNCILLNFSGSACHHIGNWHCGWPINNMETCLICLNNLLRFSWMGRTTTTNAQIITVKHSLLTYLSNQLFIVSIKTKFTPK